jgi:flavin reductase (DIM6/NTAB) family NADH-FMN oxidoreductase RutF
MFSANQTPTSRQKDTVINVEATGKFCWNLATYDLREAVNATAEGVEYGVDEFEKAGLEKEDSHLVEVNKKKIPMVKRSPVKFECEHYSTLRLPGNPPMGAVGKIVHVRIAWETYTDFVPPFLQMW